jgi:uncharacterized membrane protein (UPF0127 family)
MTTNSTELAKSSRTRNVLYAIICILVLGAVAVVTRKQPEVMSDRTRLATVATVATTTNFSYEVVTTAAQQEKGLGGRADIPSKYGMLFVFAKDDSYGFWMKDMLSSIDIIWLSDTGAILKIDASVSPSTYPKPFYPPQPVRFVLETRAGEAARYGWTVGTKLPLPLPDGK